MSELEFAPPKYAQIVSTIQRRIQTGEYPPGSMLPSETQLIREFGVSRPTVVRALQVLQSQRWIDREHGRGSYVRNRPVAGQARPGRVILDGAATADEGVLLQVGREPAPAAVAALLQTPAGTSALLGGVYQHLHTVKRLRFDHIAERIRARAASAEESRLLKIRKQAAVLNLILTVYDAEDRPLQVVDAVFPGDLHELEDVYPFSA